MDDSRQSFVQGEESTMYLSFDSDDTLSGRGFSIGGQTNNNDLHALATDDQDKTLEDKENEEEKINIIHAANVNNNKDPNYVSPLHPFDKSILNKHNALSSTPSNKASPKISEKRTPMVALGMSVELSAEHNDMESDVCKQFSNLSLSTSADGTSSTVKAEDITGHEVSIHETKKNKSVALTLLENIKEVFNEEPELERILTEISDNDKNDKVDIKVVNAERKITFSDKVDLKVPTTHAHAVPFPRPRRSYLPTTVGESRSFGFKKRMSVVVKTTLNSPARKFSSNTLGIGLNHRSYLPITKHLTKLDNGKSNKPSSSSGNGISRRSFLPITKYPTKLDEGKSRKSVCVSGIKKSIETTNVPVAATKLNSELANSFEYTCQKCGMQFRLRGPYDMHLRRHDITENDSKISKKIINLSNASSSTSISITNQCQYCDKNFALERTLHIHLMQNCSKIPPSEKRKLHFTELNHEKKAQLPKLGLAVGNNAKLTTSSINPPMAPPAVLKVPKAAHAGVIRTPSKNVPCHQCKQSFKSILEYTNHCLTVHSKKKILDNGQAKALGADKQ